MKKVLLISLLLCGIFTQAQSIRSFVDTTDIAIGQPAYLFIEIQNDANLDGFSFHPYQAADSLSKGLEILSVSYDTLKKKPYTIYQQKIGFTAWDKGVYPVQPVSTIINGDTLYTKVFTITVSEPDEPKELNDIKPIIEKKLTWKDQLFRILIILFLIILLIVGIILIFSYIKKKKSRKELEFKPNDHLSLTQNTIQKLQELEKQQLIQKGKVKIFYTDYSEMLKDFIHKRFNIPAHELFTSDLLYVLENKHLIDDRQIKTIKPLLQRADLAKYAKIIPSVEQGNEDIAQAIDWLNTIPSQSINTPSDE